MKTIGIIGGGQLGQMMAISATYMGHKVITLDPDPNCPASLVAEQIVAKYDDTAAIAKLAARADVLTYEFENVSADALAPYEDKLPQGLDLLRISQNRIFEKFYQGANQTVKKGSGLGLAITKRILEMCDGKIIVQSASGEGTIMQVLIPVNSQERRIK